MSRHIYAVMPQFWTHTVVMAWNTNLPSASGPWSPSRTSSMNGSVGALTGSGLRSHRSFASSSTRRAAESHRTRRAALRHRVPTHRSGSLPAANLHSCLGRAELPVAGWRDDAHHRSARVAWTVGSSSRRCARTRGGLGTASSSGHVGLREQITAASPCTVGVDCNTVWLTAEGTPLATPGLVLEGNDK
jgi:hypothetical protein